MFVVVIFLVLLLNYVSALEKNDNCSKNKKSIPCNLTLKIFAVSENTVFTKQ